MRWKEPTERAQENGERHSQSHNPGRHMETESQLHIKVVYGELLSPIEREQIILLCTRVNSLLSG